MSQDVRIIHSLGLRRIKRVLLIAPPAYDYRLDWSKWHQPLGLLRLGALLRSEGKDLRLIDCIATVQGERLTRRRIGITEIESYKLNKWHFGLPPEELTRRVMGFLQEGWRPDTIFVTTLNSVWWEGARDTIACVRKLLPNIRVILGGAYPTFHPEHAQRHSGANEIWVGNFTEAEKHSADLALYAQPPYATGIFFYSHPAVPTRRARPVNAKKLVKEIAEKSHIGVREFVFFDEEIHLEDRDAFADLLDEIAHAKLGVHFVVQGNVSPRLVTRDLARRMRRAKVTQVYLRCDLNFELPRIAYSTPLSEYRRSVQAMLNEGVFQPRDGNVGAMLIVGLPYENLNGVSERLIELAHIVGSVMLVPFQYVPGKHHHPDIDLALANNGHISPEGLNSKLYPLARLSGKAFNDYVELTRLATLLNSKYRSKTFDFLGDSLTARMFRESIRSEGWNPFREMDERPAMAQQQDARKSSGIIPLTNIHHDHSR